MVKAMGELKEDGVPWEERYWCLRLGQVAGLHLLVVDAGTDVAGIDGEGVEYKFQGLVESVFGGYHKGFFILCFFEILLMGYLYG